MSKIQLLLTALTDVGCIRKNNEDNFIVCQDLTKDDWFIPQEGAEPFVLGNKGSIMVVADGMGGMNAGEVASDIAVKTVKEFFAPDKLSDEIVGKPENRCQYLKQVIVEADNRIKAKSKSDPETEGMGTTIVISWAISQETHIAWCGDSRAYSYHPNAGLRQLSKDHSYVQELVDSGKLLPELAFDHPDSNIITSSLGDISKPAAPEVSTTSLHEGEIILLCSDGLCGMLRDSEMLQVLDAYYPDLNKCKKNLIDGALKAGGLDNVTLTMTFVAKGGEIMPMIREARTSSSNSSLDATTLVTKKHGKKKFVVMGIVLAVLLAIIGILGIKLAANKNNTPDEPEQVTMDSSAVQIDSTAYTATEKPEKETVKTSLGSMVRKNVKVIEEKTEQSPHNEELNQIEGLTKIKDNSEKKENVEEQTKEDRNEAQPASER